MDLAKGHVLALDAIAAGKIFEGCKDGSYRAFNLGKGKGMSVLNMIDAMKKASGFEYKYEIVGRRWVLLLVRSWCRHGDVPDLTADPAMAEKELGFVAERGLEEMCRDLWNFQTKNGDGYASK
jgi:UDP-glucose 4-epimerase